MVTFCKSAVKIFRYLDLCQNGEFISLDAVKSSNF